MSVFTETAFILLSNNHFPKQFSTNKQHSILFRVLDTFYFSFAMNSSYEVCIENPIYQKQCEQFKKMAEFDMPYKQFVGREEGETQFCVIIFAFRRSSHRLAWLLSEIQHQMLVSKYYKLL